MGRSTLILVSDPILVSGEGSSGRAELAGMPAPGAGRELRRERRRNASGPVVVRFQHERPFEVQGHLLDLSTGGFRMLHQCSALETGQTVEFSHAEASGNARVVWNRIVDRMIETGFFVLRG